jgi:hypothetical protein
MDRRQALAAAAAFALSITGLGVAVGATTEVFTAADASPNVGQISPAPDRLRPTVETHIVDVEDPAPAPAAPAPPAPVPTRTDEGPARTAPSTAPTTATTPAPNPGAPSTTLAPEPAHERGDD